MKTIIFPLLVVSATSVLTLYSQTAAAPDLTAALLKTKASNQALIERQAKTLEKLDALKQAAEQLKIFSKRG
jgi:hypothetical protein